MTSPELVVLLGPDGLPCGTASKATVHTDQTPLHLAFSVYLFDDDRLLLAQRAWTKQTWPGVWSNSCCGHPAPDETMEEAVVRRVRQELGLELTDLQLALPDFSYRAVDASGVVEHERCPVFFARALGEPVPDPQEVAATRWVGWSDLDPAGLSPWAQLQVAALRTTPVPWLA